MSSPVRPSPRVSARVSTPVLVEQVHGEPVDLQLAQVRHLADVAPHPLGPRPQVVRGEGVVQAEHALEVLVRRELGGELAADLLGGRVGRRQLRVRLLERQQLAPERVELPVRDDRRVEHVVAELVVGDLGGQLGVPRADVGIGGHLRRLATGADTFAAMLTSSRAGRRTPRPAAGTASSRCGPTPASPRPARRSGSGRPGRRGGCGRSPGGRRGRRRGGRGCAGPGGAASGSASAVTADRSGDVGRVGGGTAGTSPSSSGIPASQTSPSASSAAGRAVVAADRRAGSRRSRPRRRRSGRAAPAAGSAAQQCTTTGAPRPATSSSQQRPGRRGRRRTAPCRSPTAWAATRPAPRAGRARRAGGEPARPVRSAISATWARKPSPRLASELADGAVVGEHPVARCAARRTPRASTVRRPAPSPTPAGGPRRRRRGRRRRSAAGPARAAGHGRGAR